MKRENVIVKTKEYTPEDFTMNFSTLDYYMKVHGFSDDDRKKVYDFIGNGNRMRVGKNKFVSGFLSKTKLHLVTESGTPEVYDRTFLGV